MRVWLDDERPMPPGYDVHVRTAAEAIALIERGTVTAISFDNDLGSTEPNSEGRHVAARMEELAFHDRIPPIECRIHTSNPVARQTIFASCRNAERFWDVEGTGGR